MDFNMRKIVIRNKIVSGINSAVIRFSNDGEMLEETIGRMGTEKFLKLVLKEEMNIDCLFQEYDKFLKGKDSSLFSWMYCLDSKYGVVIDSHIYLYEYNSLNLNNEILGIPWIYVEKEKYLGDTWWSSDEEILFDLEKMNVVEFLKKYKGI